METALAALGPCGSPRREHDDNAEEDGNAVILDLYIGACGVNQHLNVMDSFKVSVDAAMDALHIPEADRAKYRAMLQS